MDSWQEKQQRADDQIAPDGVARSVDALQQWALATASMPQQPTMRPKARANKDEVRDRIQRRYENPSHQRAPTHQSEQMDNRDRVVIDLTDDAFPPLPTKRRHSLSPEKDTEGTSDVSYVRSIKRRRSRSPVSMTSAYSATRTWSHQTGTWKQEDEYDYAQSSERSFPSSPGSDREERK
jgi:hypothetical protein